MDREQARPRPAMAVVFLVIGAAILAAVGAAAYCASIVLSWVARQAFG